MTMLENHIFAYFIWGDKGSFTRIDNQIYIPQYAVKGYIEFKRKISTRVLTEVLVRNYGENCVKRVFDAKEKMQQPRAMKISVFKLENLWDKYCNHCDTYKFQLKQSLHVAYENSLHLANWSILRAETIVLQADIVHTINQKQLKLYMPLVMDDLNIQVVGMKAREFRKQYQLDNNVNIRSKFTTEQLQHMVKLQRELLATL